MSRYFITYVPFLIVHILILLGRMTIKRRGEEEEGYPDPKRARVVACDDGHETSGSLGNSTRSALSDWF